MVRVITSMIKLEDFNLDNILIDEKPHKNNFIYEIPYKTLIGSKPLCNRVNKKMNLLEFLMELDNLTLFGSEKYDAFYDRIRCLISLNSGITYILSHCFAKIKVNSYDSLPILKRLTLNNFIILIKSVLSKDKNHYYYKIFLEKCSYQLAKKIITKFFSIE